MFSSRFPWLSLFLVIFRPQITLFQIGWRCISLEMFHPKFPWLYKISLPLYTSAESKWCSVLFTEGWRLSQCMMTSSNGNIFPRYWPFVRGIHRPPVNSPLKGQWRGALMFSLIFVWINGWENNREAVDLRRHRADYDVIVMGWLLCDRWRRWVITSLVISVSGEGEAMLSRYFSIVGWKKQWDTWAVSVGTVWSSGAAGAAVNYSTVTSGDSRVVAVTAFMFDAPSIICRINLGYSGFIAF